MIKMIFAFAKSSDPLCNDLAFGLNSALPWPKNKEDFKYFQEYTKNHVICCSRKTADTLPKSVYTTLGRSLFILERHHTKKDLPLNAVIIGGATIIKEWFQCCNEISITYIEGQYDHDVILDHMVVDSICIHMSKIENIRLNHYSIATIWRDHDS